MMQHINN